VALGLDQTRPSGASHLVKSPSSPSRPSGATVSWTGRLPWRGAWLGLAWGLTQLLTWGQAGTVAAGAVESDKRGAGVSAVKASSAETNSVSSGLLSSEHRLDDPANNSTWRPLFEKLAPRRTRQSSFEERRYFPFRREPVVFRGEIRIVPDRGLSLRYLEPEPQVMIVDEKGLLMRDAAGRERAAPSDSRAQAATSALVSVLRFDLAALQQEFAMYGQRAGDAWMLAFVPRDAALTALIGTILVSGEATTLARIEMIKSPTQRIEITVSDTREGVLFTGDTLRRFFR